MCGLVVNVRPNVPRDDYDRPQAVLTNCGRHRAHGQNREGHPDFRAHLSGRVAWVEAIEWTGAAASAVTAQPKRTL